MENTPSVQSLGYKVGKFIGRPNSLKRGDLNCSCRLDRHLDGKRSRLARLQLDVLLLLIAPIRGKEAAFLI